LHDRVASFPHSPNDMRDCSAIFAFRIDGMTVETLEEATELPLIHESPIWVLPEVLHQACFNQLLVISMA